MGVVSIKRLLYFSEIVYTWCNYGTPFLEHQVSHDSGSRDDGTCVSLALSCLVVAAMRDMRTHGVNLHMYTYMFIWGGYGQ